MALYARRSNWIIPALVAAVAASTCWAGITPNGNVSPANPSTWTDSTTAYIGDTGNGSVLVNNGSTLLSSGAFLGNNTGATGRVNVDGAGSTWTATSNVYVGFSGTGTLSITNAGQVNSWAVELGWGQGQMGTGTVDGIGSKLTLDSYLDVGDNGTGTLNITNGGQVTVTGWTFVAYNNTATGSINFGPNGGTLTTRSLYYAANAQFTGTGVIDTRGLVSDGSLVFDATHGLTQTLAGNNVGQNVALHLNMTDSNTTGDLGAGYHDTGTLTIRDGVSVTSNMGYLGYKNGATGIATVSGPGSTWTTYSLFVGYSGTGTLNIANGGQVTTSETFVAYNINAWLNTGRGLINFGSNGGTLTTGALYATPAQFTGTGVINTRGLVSDGSLVFDATHGGSQTLTWINAGQNVTIHLDMTGNSGYVGALGAGYQDTGTLTIGDGMAVTSYNGYLGFKPGSTGVATVSGPGSTWTLGGSVNVGHFGTGTLNITNGGQVIGSGSPSYIGSDNAGATGMVNVDGPGSKWACSGNIYVGNSGTGTLKITNGGTVTTGGVSISAKSLVVLSVGDKSALSAGTGSLANSGLLRLRTAPIANPGSYTPITAASWSGSGTVTALGGKWNSATHVFTVAAAAIGIAGTPVQIDTSVKQRVTISDATANKSVWLGFQGTTPSSNLTVTGAMLTLAQTTALQQRVTGSTAVLAGWNFTTSGYTTGDPVALSIEIGPDFSPDTLSIYHYDGSAWSPFSAPDLSYDGTFANFTVTGFSAYAVAAPVPEPLTLSILTLGLAPLLRRRRRG